MEAWKQTEAERIADMVATKAKEAVEKEVRTMLDHFGIDLDTIDDYDGPPFELKSINEGRSQYFYVNDVLALELRMEIVGEHYGEYRATVTTIRHYED